MKTYDDDVYTPAMVAELFNVTPRTVSRWSKDGKLPYFKTLGGHRRYKKDNVDKLLKEMRHGDS